MAQKNPCPYKIEPEENFLPSHLLYRGVPRAFWERWEDLDKFEPHFFYTKNAVEGLSVDWSKYSGPIDTLQRLTKPQLTKNGIAQFKVGELKDCIQINNLPLKIKHDPLPDNQSHTNIKGINKGNTAEIRKKVSKIAEWAPNFKPKLK